MTRLFDALRKAGSASARAGAPAPAVLPGPASAVRAAAERVGSRCSEPPPGIVPFTAAVELPADVVREMTRLRVSLEAELTERIPRVVMFAAAQGGEGTSTVAAQFARTLANDARCRVLLADVHAHRPWYAPDGSPRAGTPGTDGGLARNLELLPLPADLGPGQVVAPEVMREALAAVASRYDWIVLDGPPVLESPDAGPLGEVADGVLVVVQAGRTKRPVLARSVDLLRRAGGRVLGIVLNRRRLEIPGFIYRRL